MPKLYQLYVCQNDLMGNAINHANRVALYGVQIEQEGIWPTAQLELIAREASLWHSHMCKCCQGSDSAAVPRLHWEQDREGKALMKSPLHCPAILNGPQDLHTCLLCSLQEEKNA